MKRMPGLAFAAIVSLAMLGCGGGDEVAEETGPADSGRFEFAEDGPSTTGGGNRAGAEAAASED